MFVPGMPVVVTQNTHQGLKLTNGGGYTALEVIVDKAYPGHRVDTRHLIYRQNLRSTVFASSSSQEEEVESDIDLASLSASSRR
ncbi:hypothetical protein HRG_014892 [Hirsutella rhossiliensis]